MGDVYKDILSPFRWGPPSQPRRLYRSCHSYLELWQPVLTVWNWCVGLLFSSTQTQTYNLYRGSLHLSYFCCSWRNLFQDRCCLFILRFPSDLSSQIPWHGRSKPCTGSHMHNTKKYTLWKTVTWKTFTHFETSCFLLQPFPTHGFIKYSIPQPPGRQSVEVVSCPSSSLLGMLGQKTPMIHVWNHKKDFVILFCSFLQYYPYDFSQQRVNI